MPSCLESVFRSMNIKPARSKPDRDVAFWRAYIEMLNERLPLVDRWSDGSSSWHPRVVQKLLWYSHIPNTPRNRVTAYEWLMEHAAREIQEDRAN